MTKEFLEAFSVIIRDQVMMKKTVEIFGLGTFKVVHFNQQQEQRADGTSVMMPPRDAIEFIAEKKI
jgi:nucleoid DNA-binding protein